MSSEAGKNGRIPSDEDRQRLFHSMFFGTSENEASVSVEELVDDRLKAVLGVIEKQIPEDSNELKNSALFRVASRALKYQRDNYLVGKEYAEWNAKNQHSSHEIPYDSTALSHPQITNVMSRFIPTPTVQKALTPIVANLPKNALYEPSLIATVGIIQGQQGNLETLLKNRVLQFLDNPRNRDAIKASTQGLLINQSNNNNSTTTSQSIEKDS